MCRGSYRGVPGTIQGVKGKLSWRTWHYPRVDLGSTIQGWPLSKGGSGVHYPRVATIQSQKNEPVWPRVHYPKVATIQGWPHSRTLNISKKPSEGTIQGVKGPLSKGGHYLRVATIQGWPHSRTLNISKKPSEDTIQGLANLSQGWQTSVKYQVKALSKGQPGVFSRFRPEAPYRLSKHLYRYIHIHTIDGQFLWQQLVGQHTRLNAGYIWCISS